MKMRNIQIREDRPSVMEIRYLFYFNWFPRFTINYRTDAIDCADPLIQWTLNEMGILLPDGLLDAKEISDSSIEDFLE